MDVVIGGASGIGASVVTLLGASTLTADRVGGIHFCDLQDATTLVALAATVTRLDALVITAGVSPSMADARVILDIDLTGMARVLDAFDHLIGEGTVVVCIASMAGHLGTFPAETLTALDDPLSPLALELTDDPALASMLAKHGVMRMVRRMANEYGRRGARIVPCHRE